MLNSGVYGDKYDACSPGGGSLGMEDMQGSNSSGYRPRVVLRSVD